jgi:uncharacterized protein (TIRG00374 family)
MKRLHHLLSVILVGGLILAAYRYLSWELMLEAWGKVSWTTLGLLLVLPAFYLLLKGWRFVLMMRTSQELDDRTVLAGYVASQSASLLPGGFAARSAILTQAGIPMERSVGPVLANSGMDQLVLLSCGLVLAAWYAEIRPAALTLSLLLLMVVALLTHPRSRSGMAGLLLGLSKRFGLGQKMADFQQTCWALVDGKLFFSTFILSLMADLMSYAILCLVVASLGFSVEYLPLAGAFVVPTLLGRLSPLPAGAGVTEAGMIVFLANQTAMTTNQAAAAATLMRVFDVVLPALYGALVYFLFWQREARRSSCALPAA